MPSAEDLAKIVSYGGGIVIDSSLPTDSLVKIVSQARSAGSTVVIKSAERKSPEELKRIASYGRGCVIFDLTE